MAAIPTFLDTSGYFTALVPADPRHDAARRLLEDPARRFVTTDWVVGETVNLLIARRRPHLAARFLRSLENAPGLELVESRPDLFREARDLFFRYEEQAFPFTDCTSFVVMKALRITDALTSDRHYRVMGFNPLLGDSS